MRAVGGPREHTNGAAGKVRPIRLASARRCLTLPRRNPSFPHPLPAATAAMETAAAGGAPRALSHREQMLAAYVHLGTKNCAFQMERYAFKRRSDGMSTDRVCLLSSLLYDSPCAKQNAVLAGVLR